MSKDITYDNIACSIIAIVQEDIQKDTDDNIVDYTESMAVANLIDFLMGKNDVVRICENGLILNPSKGEQS